MAKFKFSSLKKMKSQKFFSDNKTLVITIIAVIVLWKPLKALYRKFLNLVQTNEDVQEESAQSALIGIGQSVNNSNLQLTTAECKNVAHTIMVELGKHDFWLNWAGSIDVILKSLCKNASQLSSNVNDHFGANGVIRDAGTYTEPIWNSSVTIKRFEPYNKDTLKKIYVEFGTPLYDHSTGGEPVDNIFGGITGYMFGTESDWKLNNWCKANLSTYDYNKVKGIFQEVGLNYF